MRKMTRFISCQAARLVPVKWLLKQKHPVFLPFYHVVSDQPLPYITNYRYRNVAEFEQELDWYLRYFKPVSLDELIENRLQGRKVFHITFDDGLRQCADIIAPVLLRKGIPATFFINSAFAGNQDLYHRFKAALIWNELQNRPLIEVKDFLAQKNLRGPKILRAESSMIPVLDEAAGMLEISFSDFLEKEKPYMTISQIQKLMEDGFTVGAHSHNHPEFWKIGEEDQLDQVRKSMSWINKQLNPKIKVFAFPYTDSGVAGSLLLQMKQEQLFDVSFGTAGIKFDTFDFHFQRYPVEESFDLNMGIKSEFIYLGLRKIVGKHKVRH